MYEQQKLLDNLNKIMRNDAYVMEICKATGLEMRQIKSIIQEIYNNLFFETMTFNIDIIAREMGITFKKELTREEKISIIKAKMRSYGKGDAILLQRICDSWHRGVAKVNFVNRMDWVAFENWNPTWDAWEARNMDWDTLDHTGIQARIRITFEKGIPSDLDSLKKSIYEAKPAHLEVEYYAPIDWDKLESLAYDWNTFEEKFSSWDAFEEFRLSS